MRYGSAAQNTRNRRLERIRMTGSDWMELGFAGLVAVSSLFLLLRAHHYVDKVRLEPEEIPPIFFPRIVLFLAFALCLAVILRIVLRNSKEAVELAWPGVRRMLVVLAALLAYLLLFRMLGFIIATTLLMLFLSRYYGNRNLLKLLALALLFPPLIYFLFTRLFHIMLPRGLL